MEPEKQNKFFWSGVLTPENDCLFLRQIFKYTWPVLAMYSLWQGVSETVWRHGRKMQNVGVGCMAVVSNGKGARWFGKEKHDSRGVFRHLLLACFPGLGQMHSSTPACLRTFHVILALGCFILLFILLILGLYFFSLHSTDVDISMVSCNVFIIDL